MSDTNNQYALVHENHFCEHPSCNRWGAFGYERRGKTEWFCLEHKPEKVQKDR